MFDHLEMLSFHSQQHKQSHTSVARDRIVRTLHKHKVSKLNWIKKVNARQVRSVPQQKVSPKICLHISLGGSMELY